MVHSNTFLVKLLDNKYRLLQHLVFIGSIFLFWLLFTLNSSYYNYPRWKVALFSLTYVLVSYFNIYVLFQRFLLQGKVIWYGVLSLLTFIASYLTQAFIYFKDWESFRKDFTPGVPLLADFMINIMTYYMFIGFGLSVKLIKVWVINEKRIIGLEKESLRAKLDNLKSQVSPHFLFNTFNNLYVLVKTKPDLAAEMILGFSDLMRYQLNECDKEKVSLEKEIKYVQNFLTLEKLRKDNLDVRINYNPESIAGIEIEPLLLVTLIENAVKHGSQQMENAFIHVNLQREGNVFSIEVVNSKPEVASLGKENSLQKGIQNLRNRLNLSYPALHQLKLVDLKNKYLAKLEITLT